jgi:hypothetical protein
MELDPSDFEIAATISNTLSLVRERAQRRSITLRSAVDPTPRDQIHADERKVRQVLLNPACRTRSNFTPRRRAHRDPRHRHDDRTEDCGNRLPE